MCVLATEFVYLHGMRSLKNFIRLNCVWWGKQMMMRMLAPFACIDGDFLFHTERCNDWKVRRWWRRRQRRRQRRRPVRLNETETIIQAHANIRPARTAYTLIDSNRRTHSIILTHIKNNQFLNWLLSCERARALGSGGTFFCFCCC